MPDTPSFDDVKAGLQAGDHKAAKEIYDRYARRLAALARARLHRQVEQRVGSEDVLQSVFRSFFTRYTGPRFDVQDWDSLWALLAKITARKCSRKNEHFHAQKRDVSKEIHLSPGGGDSSDVQFDPSAPDPTASDVVEVADTIEHLLNGLDERDRRIFELRLEGFTVPEISEQVGFTERTIQRRLDHIRARLEGMQEGE